MGKDVDLLQGTLNLLILKAVSLGPLHGYAVLLRIQQLSGDRMEIHQGTLYPALYRLEQQGLLSTKWAPSENNRRAKFYTLTRSGKRQLELERRKWKEMAETVAVILGAERAPVEKNA
jgi:PadR family transcriptional regulator PadR